jgi:hypothetical protein
MKRWKDRLFELAQAESGAFPSPERFLVWLLMLVLLVGACLMLFWQI